MSGKDSFLKRLFSRSRSTDRPAIAQTYAIVWAENADFVGCYDTEVEAVSKLKSFLRRYPAFADEIGLRKFDKQGRPAGPWISGTDVLRGVR